MSTAEQFYADKPPTIQELIMSELLIDQELDCSGLLCPLPIIKTKQLMDTMRAGELLRLVATDPGSLNDVQAWSRMKGNELVDHDESDGVFTYYLRKT